MDDIEVDPLTVDCPMCLAPIGDACAGRRICHGRGVLARTMARRTNAADSRLQSTQAGLAKVRAALETAYGARR